MLPYIIVFSILFFLMIFDIENHLEKFKYTALFFSFFVLLIFIGFRDETGTDWLSYKQNYDNVLRGDDVNPHFEAGYNLFVSIFSKIGINYTFFLFLYTFVYLALFYNFFRKSNNPNTIVFLFYATYAIGYMGAARQVLAIALCLNAFAYLMQDKYRRSFFITILAATIHYPSIIFLSIFFFKRFYNISFKRLILSLIIIVIIYLIMPVLINYLLNVSFLTEQLINYSATDDGQTVFVIDDNFLIFLMFAKRLTFILFFLWVLHRWKVGIDFKIALNFYACGFFIFSLFYFTLPAVGVRLSLYFSIFDIFLFSYFRFSKKSHLLILLVTIAFATERLNSSLSYDSDLLMPYKAIFINQDLHRILRQ